LRRIHRGAEEAGREAEKISIRTFQQNGLARAYGKIAGPHTSVETEAKNDVRKAAFARRFVAQYLKFDPETNEDRTAMNFHNRDTFRS
jgi:hypothetical protein